MKQLSHRRCTQPQLPPEAIPDIPLDDIWGALGLRGPRRVGGRARSSGVLGTLGTGPFRCGRTLGILGTGPLGHRTIILRFLRRRRGRPASPFVLPAEHGWGEIWSSTSGSAALLRDEVLGAVLHRGGPSPALPGTCPSPPLCRAKGTHNVKSNGYKNYFENSNQSSFLEIFLRLREFTFSGTGDWLSSAKTKW